MTTDQTDQTVTTETTDLDAGTRPEVPGDVPPAGPDIRAAVPPRSGVPDDHFDPARLQPFERRQLADLLGQAAVRRLAPAELLEANRLLWRASRFAVAPAPSVPPTDGGGREIVNALEKILAEIQTQTKALSA